MINLYGYSYTTTSGETIVVQNPIEGAYQARPCFGGLSYYVPTVRYIIPTTRIFWG